jgi:uncharacterized protein
MVAAIAALALVSGVLIGCISIGGVFLVPCLSLAGVDVHAAIGASMFSFIFSGAIGVWLYARHGSIAWRSATWLAAGAAPAAFLGALLAASRRCCSPALAPPSVAARRSPAPADPFSSSHC